MTVVHFLPLLLLVLAITLILNTAVVWTTSNLKSFPQAAVFSVLA